MRAARANRVFCTDEKRIRTENTVIVNTKQAVWVLYKIADCARTASRPRNKRNSTVCNLNFQKVLAVVLELLDRFVDVGQRLVLAVLG